MIIVGLMSDASVESIDVAVCEIAGVPPSLHAEVLSSLSIPWPLELRKMVLETAWQPDPIDMADLCLLDVAVGEAYAAAALEGIVSAGFYPEQIDLIGMHGQTVRNEVHEDGHVMASLQLGQPAIVSEWTGITTISDFRQRDIAAGGQGAPLIGYVDWLLLRDMRRFRAIQYLDSIATVVFLPPKSVADGEPTGFDIGPGTVLIDYAESRLNAQSGTPDSAPGVVSEDLLTLLLSNPYLQRRPPKTVGQLVFNQSLANEIWDHAINAGISPASILETFVAFTVQSIASAYRQFAPNPVDEVIFAGKGRRYPGLMRRLRSALEPASIRSHEDLGMESDSKYALGVALLAHEAWHNRPCTHPALTGAQHAIPLGCILPGLNYRKLVQVTWESGR